MKNLLYIVCVSCSILLFSCRTSRSASSASVEVEEFSDTGSVASSATIAHDSLRIKDTTRLFRVQDTLFIVKARDVFRVRRVNKIDTVVKWRSCQHKEIELVQEKERSSPWPLVFVCLGVGIFLFLLFYLKK